VGTSEQRMETNVPLQRLFFMNSDFVMSQAKTLASHIDGGTDSERISRIYEAVYERRPTADETKLGLEFLKESKDAWPRYAQVLLSSNEFEFVN
jgi:hypothetical protein